MTIKLDVKKIRHILIERGVRQGKMAKDLGMSRGLLSYHFMVGSPKHSAKFAEYLGMSPKDLIVLRPEEWERDKNLPGTVAYPAAHEGVVIYAT